MKNILEVKNLKKHFSLGSGFGSLSVGGEKLLRAVDGVSFNIQEGEVLGLVGESGCGKTTTGKVILRLLKKTDGDVLFEGKSVEKIPRRGMKEFRSAAQMVFQDLDAALNPKMKIRNILGESVRLGEDIKGEKLEKRLVGLLKMVNLKPAKLDTYPGLLSGGEKRRISLARVLARKPRLIIADEPLSALDLSIQAQVANLLKDLQKAQKLSFLLISHDLRMVELLSHRIAVMYLGKIVELGTSAELVKRLFHPYTRALWASTVVRKKGEKVFGQLKGDVFEYGRPEEGCVFAPRCPIYIKKGKPKKCACELPELRELKRGHLVACHYPLGK
jgi:oligopeptide/dipeptide ABC transporter ATP-binding protein